MMTAGRRGAGGKGYCSACFTGEYPVALGRAAAAASSDPLPPQLTAKIRRPWRSKETDVRRSKPQLHRSSASKVTELRRLL